MNRLDFPGVASSLLNLKFRSEIGLVVATGRAWLRSLAICHWNISSRGAWPFGVKNPICEFSIKP